MFSTMGNMIDLVWERPQQRLRLESNSKQTSVRLTGTNAKCVKSFARRHIRSASEVLHVCQLLLNVHFESNNVVRLVWARDLIE